MSDNIYEFMLDCDGGPRDGTSFAKINVTLPQGQSKFTVNEMAASVDEQFSQHVFLMTNSGNIGSQFLDPFPLILYGQLPKEEKPGTISQSIYEITDRIVDEENRQILCRADFKGYQSMPIRFPKPPTTT